MRATKYADSKATLDAWIKFSEKGSVQADSSMLSRAFGNIADAALETLVATPSIENKAFFWEWQRKNESLLEQLNDVYFLYMSKLFTGKFLCHLSAGSFYTAFSKSLHYCRSLYLALDTRLLLDLAWLTFGRVTTTPITPKTRC